MAEITWEKPPPLDIRRISGIFLYQYGVEPEELGLSEYDVSRSRKTGRIRYIGVGGKIYATIRATDGFIVPLPPLAAKLVEKTEYKVTVCDDAAEYVGRGRTVFARHVVSAGVAIRPGDEVVVTDTRGNAVALGKALLPGAEMLAAKKGKAVKTRHGLLK